MDKIYKYQYVIIDFIQNISEKATVEGNIIVNINIISEIINLVPEDRLKAYWLSKSPHIQVRSPRFGHWIKKIRLDTGLSQTEFAKKISSPTLKLSQSNISELETGKRGESYRENRLEKIKKAALKLIVE